MRKRNPRRVYIAGPMTLYRDTDWGAAAFGAAASRIRHRGDVAVSPVDLDVALWGFDSRKQRKLPAIMTRRRVLAFDIGVVIPTCDVIYMLRGWSRSSGARAELAAALTYGLKVEWEPGAESPVGISFWPKGVRLDGTKAKNGRNGKGRAQQRRKAAASRRARKPAARRRGRAAVGADAHGPRTVPA